MATHSIILAWRIPGTEQPGGLPCMGSPRVRHNWCDLAAASAWGSQGKNTQRNYTKKDLHDPDNHDDVITHLEPDILKCEVKWALGSITTNKASGDDGILVELLQILEDDAVKVLHSTCQQIWKTQQWPQDWKRSSFQSNPKAMQRIFKCQRMFKLPHNCTHLTH